ncbi:hypothetical protein [Variovorax sp. YR216]|uniref:hypothetical protein n=1 Tax=Variovorax sp. YR216 TaxID=1882828 RepID=UPI00089A17D2|nr:hypothetical protein [Variovorax sp. YR216]SEB26319.1 hypothetical protein SAMN05444680_13118 [Variovorax sp. YR216]
MASLTCIDCGRSLIPTARSCLHCSSDDPFGHARRRERLAFIAQVVITVLLILLAIAVNRGWVASAMLDDASRHLL